MKEGIEVNLFSKEAMYFYVGLLALAWMFSKVNSSPMMKASSGPEGAIGVRG